MLVIGILLSWLPLLAAQTPPVVVTKYGKVEGFTFEESSDVRADIFLGIPFAKPPVGELRLEKPVEPDAWADTLEATRFRPGCPPHHRSAIGSPISEDCLYLNVMAPSQHEVSSAVNKRKYPVLVWIHGGGFSIGSAHLYDHQKMTRNFVARGIVVVTLQYRLGPFGFLSSGDEVLPGNIGYWDKTAALRFVNENIANFGGDPNRVTVFGLSSGGASVGGLTISPHSRDLFQQSIDMSGPTLAEWASSESVVEASKELALHLNCSHQNSIGMKRCMKTKSVEQIMDTVEQTGKSRYATNIIKYGPRFDGDFFPKQTEDLIREAPPKPTVLGTAENEGLFFAILGESDCLQQLSIPPDRFESYGEEDLVGFIREVVAPIRVFGGRAGEVQGILIDYYLNETGGSPREDFRFFLDRYTQLITDVLFHVPIAREARMKLNAGWPLWLYVTDHHNRALYPEHLPLKGATHVGEFPYMFDIFPYGEFAFDEDEKRMKNVIVDALTSFVVNGSHVEYHPPRGIRWIPSYPKIWTSLLDWIIRRTPSTTNQQWDPITSEHPTRNLRFRPDAVMEDGFFDETVEFWDSMDAFDFDIIRGVIRDRAMHREEL